MHDWAQLIRCQKLIAPLAWLGCEQMVGLRLVVVELLTCLDGVPRRNQRVYRSTSRFSYYFHKFCLTSITLFTTFNNFKPVDDLLPDAFWLYLHPRCNSDNCDNNSKPQPPSMQIVKPDHNSRPFAFAVMHLNDHHVTSRRIYWARHLSLLLLARDPLLRGQLNWVLDNSFENNWNLSLSKRGASVPIWPFQYCN